MESFSTRQNGEEEVTSSFSSIKIKTTRSFYSQHILQFGNAARAGGNYSWHHVVSFVGFCQRYASVGYTGWLDCSAPAGFDVLTFLPSHGLSHRGIVFLKSATLHHDSKWAS